MKRKIPRIAWLALLNAMTLLLLSALIVAKLWPESRVPDASIEKADGPVTPISPKRTSITDMQKAPLFSPSRQPVIEDAAPAQNAVILTQPPVLIGILGERGDLRALLEDPLSSSTRKLVQRGEVFAGWKLASVDSKKAELQAGDRKVVLDLSIPRSGSSLTTAPSSMPAPSSSSSSNNVNATQVKTTQ